jgi:hypothetical protein
MAAISIGNWTERYISLLDSRERRLFSAVAPSATARRSEPEKEAAILSFIIVRTNGCKRECSNFYDERAMGIGSGCDLIARCICGLKTIAIMGGDVAERAGNRYKRAALTHANYFGTTIRPY